METKVCTKCGNELPATTEYFYKNKLGKFGLKSTCKQCSKAQKLVWDTHNKDKVKEYQRRKYYKYSEKYKIISSNRYYNNKEKILEAQHIYYKLNKQECDARQKKWRHDNPTKSKIIGLRSYYKNKDKK